MVRNLNYIFILFILLSSAKNCFSQMWKFDSDDKANYLDNLFYQNLSCIKLDFDSNYLVFTSHKTEKYWEKENLLKSQLIVSKIDKSLNITVIKILDKPILNPLIYVANKKYFILDKEYKYKKKKIYYDFYIYDSLWNLERQFAIPNLSHQLGFEEVCVDKNNNIYLISKPYFIDHKQEDFKGSYLLKVSYGGEISKTQLFDKSYLKDLVIESDSLRFNAHHQKLKFPFYQTDSIFHIRSDTNLNYNTTLSKEYLRKEKGILNDITLKNGERVVYFDSSYSLSENSSTSTFKIIFLGADGTRLWTIEPNSYRIVYENPKPLMNGKFMTIFTNRFYTTQLVLFDKQGIQNNLISLSEGIITDTPKYRIINYYELKRNMIVIFYEKLYKSLKEEIQFKVIRIND